MSAYDDHIQDQRADGVHDACPRCGNSECTCPDSPRLSSLLYSEFGLEPMPTALGLELEATLRQLKEVMPLTEQGVRTLRALLAMVYKHGRVDALEAAALPDHNSRRD